MPADGFVGEPGRLDVVLARLTGLTRAEIQRSIAAGHVTVDDVVRSKSFALLGGESLVVVIDDEVPLQPEGPAVPVRFEDEYLLVVAKPAGVVTHPTERRRSGTLVNRLLFMGVPLSTIGGPFRPATNALVFAMTPMSSGAATRTSRISASKSSSVPKMGSTER